MVFGTQAYDQLWAQAKAMGDADGDKTDIYPDTIKVRQRLQQLGWPDDQLWYYLDHGGGHNEASWGERFALPLRALYSAASPVEVDG